MLSPSVWKRRSAVPRASPAIAQCSELHSMLSACAIPLKPALILTDGRLRNKRAGSKLHTHGAPAYFTSSYCMFRFACCASILHLMSVNWIPSCTHRCATESEARKMHVEMQHSKHEKANKRQSLCAKRAHALTRLGSSRQKSMLGTASTPRGTPARYTPRSAVHKRIGYTHQPLNIKLRPH